MPKVPLENLQTGDIVLFEWNDGRWHTGIYFDQVSGQRQLLAHCEGHTHGTSTDAIGPLVEMAKNTLAFRLSPARADALPKILPRVQSWAPLAAARGTTQYGEPRGSAVIKEYDRTAPGTAPPFEYDALYRVFKWLTRTELFSKNQGTTCCAFVIACFQAGLMEQHLEEQGFGHGYPRRVLEHLKERRAPKQKPSADAAASIFEKEQAEREKATRRPYTPQELLKIRARRQFSNAGSRLGPIPIEEHWGMIKDETGGPSFDQTTLQEILADALFCDAKYTYSHTLCLRLAAAPTFWTRIS